MTNPVPCACGNPVDVFNSEGGRGTGMTTSYAVSCPKCGIVVDGFPSNCSGKRADAIREWNKFRKENKND